MNSMQQNTSLYFTLLFLALFSCICRDTAAAPRLVPKFSCDADLSPSESRLFPLRTALRLATGDTPTDAVDLRLYADLINFLVRGERSSETRVIRLEKQLGDERLASDLLLELYPALSDIARAGPTANQDFEASLRTLEDQHGPDLDIFYFKRDPSAQVATQQTQAGLRGIEESIAIGHTRMLAMWRLAVEAARAQERQSREGQSREGQSREGQSREEQFSGAPIPAPR